jgi:two-component system LytT family response regulator
VLRTLIIDDELHIRDTLAKLLARHCPQVSVAGVASGVGEGISAINDLRPDLIFLDINMKDGTGFDLLRSLNRIDFRIIFISACDRRMSLAFDLSGMECLSKPFDPVRLTTAVKNAEQIELEDQALQLKALDANIK